VAEVLREDQVGFETEKKVCVNGVDAFAAADQLAHLAVDFFRSQRKAGEPVRIPAGGFSCCLRPESFERARRARFRLNVAG